MIRTIINQLAHLRPAFSRNSTYFWFLASVMGFALCQEHTSTITAFVRALNLQESTYHSLLHFFHSSAVNLGELCQLWSGWFISTFSDRHVEIAGRRVFLADAIKIAKQGARMPGVVTLHQESDNNSKPEYIRGHFIQVITGLLRANFKMFSLPLIAKIHGAYKQDKTLKQEFAEFAIQQSWLQGGLLVADCWYACKDLIKSISESLNLVLVSRVAKNAVAYALACPFEQARRGRKKLYGEKIKLQELFHSAIMYSAIIQNSAGENVCVSYWCKDLLWKPLGMFVRFVGVEYPGKGRVILICTDISIHAQDIIQAYTLRFQIEHGFKAAKHVLFNWGYRFWSRAIEKVPSFGKLSAIDLEKLSFGNRENFMRKLKAYELYIMVGFIVQGMFQYLSLYHRELILASFNCWFRTFRPGMDLSEQMVKGAFQNSWLEFLTSSKTECAFKKFYERSHQKASQKHPHGKIYADSA